MFDLGMWELMLVGLVALLVLGPEKLPKAARMAGYWVRRARQSWYAVRSEIERELAADEFKRSIRDSRQALDDSVKAVRDSGEHIERSITGHVPGLNDASTGNDASSADGEGVERPAIDSEIDHQTDSSPGQDKAAS